MANPVLKIKATLPKAETNRNGLTPYSDEIAANPKKVVYIVAALSVDETVTRVVDGKKAPTLLFEQVEQVVDGDAAIIEQMLTNKYSDRTKEQESLFDSLDRD